MFALSFGPDAVCLTDSRGCRCLTWDQLGSCVLGDGRVPAATTVHVEEGDHFRLTTTDQDGETKDTALSVAEFFELFETEQDIIDGAAALLRRFRGKGN